MNYLINLLTLNKIHGLGPLKIRQLTSHIEEGNIEDFFATTDIPSLLSSKFKEEYFQRLKSGLRGQIQSEIEFCVNQGIRIIPYWSQEFPHRLKQANDYPNCIYVKGDPPLNPPKTIALVGTRKPGNSSIKWMEQFMEEVQDDTVQILSGLAYGIDIAAHKKALQLSQSTIAIMAHGLDRIYPSAHSKTAQSMFENQGGLISEMPMGTAIHPDLFPRRNRLIAALSDAVIVVESKVTGGSMSTAILAHQYNRDVFAVPTLPGQSSGCNALIKRNTAQLIESGQDFKTAMGWKLNSRKRKADLFSNLTDEHQQIISLWSTESLNMPLHFDEIYRKCKIKMSKLPQLLLELELQGEILHLGNKQFKLTSNV